MKNSGKVIVLQYCYNKIPKTYQEFTCWATFSIATAVSLNKTLLKWSVDYLTMFIHWLLGFQGSSPADQPPITIPPPPCLTFAFVKCSFDRACAFTCDENIWNKCCCHSPWLLLELSLHFLDRWAATFPFHIAAL